MIVVTAAPACRYYYAPGIAIPMFSSPWITGAAEE